MIYADFLDYVAPWCPGAPTPMMLQEIRNAMIELCEKALIIQRDHSPITLIQEVTEYDFEPPEGYLVTKIMKAWYLGRPVQPDNLDDMRLGPLGYAYNNLVIPHAPHTVGEPRMYSQKDEYGFFVWPMPKETKVDGWQMRVALKPKRICPDECDPVDDMIFEDYAETIAAGAKRRLMLMPKKPYSDKEQAMAEQTLFMAGMNVARQRAVRGYVRSDSRVNIPRI